MDSYIAYKKLHDIHNISYQLTNESEFPKDMFGEENKKKGIFFFFDLFTIGLTSLSLYFNSNIFLLFPPSTQRDTKAKKERNS